MSKTRASDHSRLDITDGMVYKLVYSTNSSWIVRTLVRHIPISFCENEAGI
jgi:hypothetical protein